MRPRGQPPSIDRARCALPRLRSHQPASRQSVPDVVGMAQREHEQRNDGADAEAHAPGLLRFAHARYTRSELYGDDDEPGTAAPAGTAPAATPDAPGISIGEIAVADDDSPVAVEAVPVRPPRAQ